MYANAQTSRKGLVTGEPDNPVRHTWAEVYERARRIAGGLAAGYTTVAGFPSAQDDQGWYDTGDLGYLTEAGSIVVCGRVKDVIVMAGRNIYPTDIERAAARVPGVRPGCAAAVAPGSPRVAGNLRRRGRIRGVGGSKGGASHRAARGAPGRGGGGCPAPQRGRARARDNPEDAIGKAAAGLCFGACELMLAQGRASRFSS
jgi:hypothetical protein